MNTLQYTIIKTQAQYKKYCERLEVLLEGGKKSKIVQDEVDLLTLLIENYDDAHTTFSDLDPIQLLHALMIEHQLKAKDLVEILQTSKGYVSEMLHYKKGLSKDVIRKLAGYFKVSQEAFNRPYQLKVPENIYFSNARVMNTRKNMVAEKRTKYGSDER